MIRRRESSKVRVCYRMRVSPVICENLLAGLDEMYTCNRVCPDGVSGIVLDNE